MFTGMVKAGGKRTVPPLALLNDHPPDGESVFDKWNKALVSPDPTKKRLPT